MLYKLQRAMKVDGLYTHTLAKEERKNEKEMILVALHRIVAAGLPDWWSEDIDDETGLRINAMQKIARLTVEEWRTSEADLKTQALQKQAGKKPRAPARQRGQYRSRDENIDGLLDGIDDLGDSFQPSRQGYDREAYWAERDMGGSGRSGPSPSPRGGNPRGSYDREAYWKQRDGEP